MSSNKSKKLLEVRLSALGGIPTAPVKDVVAAVAGVAAGLINAVRPSETVKSLRDDAVFFSGLGVSYLLLYTTACGLNDQQASELAQRGYEGTARTVIHFDRVLPKVTIEEVRAQKLDVSDFSRRVNAMVRMHGTASS